MNNKKILASIISIILIFSGVYYKDEIKDTKKENVKTVSYSVGDIPEYNGESYIVINNNKSNFTEEEKKETKSFEKYSDLDKLGRCGIAYANINKDLMPTEERKSIGMIKPTGWHTIKYDIVDGKYLYNRCHLIGFQLTGENANEKNLITCTRSMNTGTMLDYENKVAEYIRKTNNHVLYRVTPLFKNDNLLASGVQMEGYSIEDNGKGIEFNIYVYNVEDGIFINYENGESSLK